MQQGLFKSTGGSFFYLAFKGGSFNGRNSSKLLLEAVSEGAYKNRDFGKETEHRLVKLLVPLEFC
jgi:hypothetical protein